MAFLHAAGAVVSPPGRPFTDDLSDGSPPPALLSFYRDLVEPFGCAVDEELLRGTAPVRHRDLVDRLAAAEGVRDAEPDLVVVAHALPDVTPFTAIAPHLNMLLGGAATSFGISQQGLAAPFTALRVIEAFRRAGRCREAVLAVLEQTTLPTRFPLVHDTPLTDSGVVLLFGDGPVGEGTSGEEAGPRTAGVESADGPAAASRRLAELAADDPEGTLLVLGPWADPRVPDGVRTYRAGAGTYCTGVWLALARHWRDWRREARRIVLCDTEPGPGPHPGRSHLALLVGDGAGVDGAGVPGGPPCG